MLLVLKPDGCYRFVIDYRKLNSMTISHFATCWIVSNLLDPAEQNSSQPWIFNRVISKYSLQSLPRSILHKYMSHAAFVTHDGLYEFNRMSLGLTNAPACFTQLMSRVLQNLNWEIALLYLDDIICCSKNFEEHIANLRTIFERLRSAKFFGHIVSEQGLAPLPEKY